MNKRALMFTCLQLCLLILRTKIERGVTRDLVADIRDLSQDLRDKLCLDRKTCLILINNTRYFERRIAVTEVRLFDLIYNVDKVFCNVVCLDVGSIYSWATVNMPTVEKLVLRFCSSRDEEWLRISAMFPSVTNLELRGESKWVFAFTESWLSGVAFPKLTRIRIWTHIVVIFGGDVTWMQRDIACFKLAVYSSSLIDSTKLFWIINPATIQRFCVSGIDGRNDTWWKSVRFLRRVRMDNAFMLSLLLRRSDAELQTEQASFFITSCDLGTPDELFAFAKQERRTLRILSVSVSSFFDCVWQKLTDVALRLFSDNPRLEIVKLTTHGSEPLCFVFFVPSLHNTAWVKRKTRNDPKNALREFYAVDNSGTFHKTDIQ